MQKLSLGVDIGGSHITSQLVDVNKNSVLKNSMVRINVDNNFSKNKIIEKWTSAIQKTINTAKPKMLSGIGFAMPGPFDYKNGIALFDENVKKFAALNGVNIKNEIQKHLNLPNNFPIRFINDAAAFAIGEASCGLPAKYKRILAITLGTGFGTTFLEDLIPVAGKYNIPDDGFLYHVPFKSSIADDYFSTRWFINEYKNKTNEKISDVKNLIELCPSNKLVDEIFNQFGKNLGTFLSTWLKQFDVECLIIGGNIAKSYRLFQKEMERQFFLNGIQPEICISSLGENASIIGSARITDNQFYSKLYN